MRLALSRLSSRSSNDKNISLSLSLWLSSKCVLDNDANVLPENLLLLGKLSERERENSNRVQVCIRRRRLGRRANQLSGMEFYLFRVCR